MQAREMLKHRRLTEWGVPAVLLALPIFSVFWLNELGALLLLATAFAVGLLLRPKHLWIVWIEAILLTWLGGGFYSLFGPDPAPGEPQETVVSFMFEAIIFMAILVLLPMFLGRLIPGVRRLLRDVDRKVEQH
jgi:hypothetical protein